MASIRSLITTALLSAQAATAITIPYNSTSNSTSLSLGTALPSSSYSSSASTTLLLPTTFNLTTTSPPVGTTFNSSAQLSTSISSSTTFVTSPFNSAGPSSSFVSTSSSSSSSIVSSSNNSATSQPGFTSTPSSSVASLSSTTSSISTTLNGTTSLTSQTSFSSSSSSSSSGNSTTTPSSTTNAQTTVIGGVTETLIPTTATDSSGVTFIGTITQATSSSTTPIVGLTTYTEFPPSITYSATTTTANGHDSSGRPVLAPWPLCWFCPPDSHGIVLVNWPGPGIFPGGGPPAGFPTPFPPITIGPNGDPTYPASPSPIEPTTDPTTSTSSSSTCTETETATDITYFISYVTEAGGSTLSTSTYSIASTQVKGCSVTGTTVTSTTATGALSYCSAGCASCNVKRSLPSATLGPAARSNALVKKSPLQSESLFARDIPESGFGIPTLYSDVRESDNTISVPLDQAPVAGSVIEIGVSSSRFTYFDNAEHNILVEGLVGCTSVVVVSRLGAWASHFWEAPSFRDQDNGQGTDPFDLDVLDYMQLGRNGETNTEILSALVQGGVFGGEGTDYNTNIYIMTPATRNLDLNGADSDSLANGDNPALYGSDPGSAIDRLSTLEEHLSAMMPGIPISKFVYQRQNKESLAGNGVYGSALILYSNKQQYDPNFVPPADDPYALAPELPAPQKAAWQVWMQGKKMGDDTWDALAGQTCSGNSKRQDGGACTLPASASNTASSGTATASVTATASATSNAASTSTDVGCLILNGIGSCTNSSTPSTTTSVFSTTSSTFATITTAPSTSYSCGFSTEYITTSGSSTTSEWCSCADGLTTSINTVTTTSGICLYMCAIPSTSIQLGGGICPTPTSTGGPTTTDSALTATGTCDTDSSNDEYGQCAYVGQGPDDNGIVEVYPCPASAPCGQVQGTCTYFYGNNSAVCAPEGVSGRF